MSTQHLLQPLEVTHVKHTVVEEDRSHEVRQARPAERGQVRGSEGTERAEHPASEDSRCQAPPHPHTPILPPFILKGSMEDHEPSAELWPR